MKLNHLAYLILCSAFLVSTVSQAAQIKRPLPVQKKTVETKPYEPQPICGTIDGHAISIPTSYALSGVIYDLDSPGEGCKKAIVVAGLYVNLNDLDKPGSMDIQSDESVYLVLGSVDKPYELGARKAIDTDIVSREISKAAGEQPAESLVSRQYGGINAGRYYRYDYEYLRDAAGAMTPFKICKTVHQGDITPESCEFIYRDKTYGIGFSVGFSADKVYGYDQMRSVALKVISGLRETE